MIRIGQGFDVHQLVPQRPLIIGGLLFLMKRSVRSLRCRCFNTCNY